MEGFVSTTTAKVLTEYQRPEYCRIIRDISFASVSQKVMEACGKLLLKTPYFISEWKIYTL
jgi:hypothetical protein